MLQAASVRRISTQYLKLKFSSLNSYHCRTSSANNFRDHSSAETINHKTSLNLSNRCIIQRSSSQAVKLEKAAPRYLTAKNSCQRQDCNWINMARVWTDWFNPEEFNQTTFDSFSREYLQAETRIPVNGALSVDMFALVSSLFTFFAILLKLLLHVLQEIDCLRSTLIYQLSDWYWVQGSCGIVVPAGEQSVRCSYRDVRFGVYDACGRLNQHKHVGRQPSKLVSRPWTLWMFCKWMRSRRERDISLVTMWMGIWVVTREEPLPPASDSLVNIHGSHGDNTTLNLNNVHCAPQ